MNNQKILKYKTNLNFHPHSQNQFSSFKTKKKHSNSLNKYSSAPSDIITQVPQNSQKTFFTRPISLTPSNRLQSSFKRMLLPPKEKKYENKKTLILDLDETLVHSSFSPVASYDVKLHITYKKKIFPIYVNIRPHVESFLLKMSSLFHIYIFTASIAEYADKVIDCIDTQHVIEKRFYREHCTYHKGIYVKDIRKYIDSSVDINDVVIVDNNPVSFLFNPSNGVAIKTWHSDKKDTELLRVGAMLENKLCYK